MPSNDPEYQRQYKQKHYVENKSRYIEQAIARKAKLRAEVQKFKEVPCTDCKMEYPYWVMHFDHVENDRNGDKTVSQLVSSYSRKKVYEAIAKCEVVCANCHADRTYKRGIGVSG